MALVVETFFSLLVQLLGYKPAMGLIMQMADKVDWLAALRLRPVELRGFHMVDPPRHKRSYDVKEMDSNWGSGEADAVDSALRDRYIVKIEASNDRIIKSAADTSVRQHNRLRGLVA